MSGAEVGFFRLNLKIYYNWAISCKNETVQCSSVYL